MDIITLLKGLLEELSEIEEKFYEEPKDLYSLELSVKDVFTQKAAE